LRKNPEIKKACCFQQAFKFNLGGVLLSHTVAHAVPSALKGLTSVFGMGTGVSPSPWSPRNFLKIRSGFRVLTLRVKPETRNPQPETFLKEGIWMKGFGGISPIMVKPIDLLVSVC
jgi:hypothetical protein